MTESIFDGIEILNPTDFVDDGRRTAVILVCARKGEVRTAVDGIKRSLAQTKRVIQFESFYCRANETPEKSPRFTMNVTEDELEIILSNMKRVLIADGWDQDRLPIDVYHD